MTRAEEKALTRRQRRALEFLARAAETDGELLIIAEDLPWTGNRSNTLKGLAKRGLAVAADASEWPFLWRVTLAGLVLARELRSTLPERGDRGNGDGTVPGERTVGTHEDVPRGAADGVG